MLLELRSWTACHHHHDPQSGKGGAHAGIADPISFAINTNDVIDVFVDHIELNATTLRPTIERHPLAGSSGFNVPLLEIQQDLTAYLVTGGELKTRNQAPFHY